MCKIFDENDGTEIDDSECLLSYEKGSIFIIGKEWKSFSPDTVEESTSRSKGQDDKHLGESTKMYAEKNEAEIILAKTDETVCLEDHYEPNVDSNWKDCGDGGNGNDDDLADDDMESQVVLLGEIHGENNEQTTELTEECATHEIRAPEKRKEYTDIGIDKEEEPTTSFAKRSRPATVTEELLNINKYRNARLKNLKVYSEEQISNAMSTMEKTRMRFWNEKAEQLATKQKTAGLSKSILIGIIDVAWTLRKTSLIEEEERRMLDAEKVLFESGEAPVSKKFSQKKHTIPKNMDRMSAAHVAVESLDKEMEDLKALIQKGPSKKKETLQQQYKNKKILLDGAYTELKRAQDAALKAIRGKKKFLDGVLKEKSMQPNEEQS